MKGNAPLWIEPWKNKELKNLHFSSDTHTREFSVTYNPEDATVRNDLLLVHLSTRMSCTGIA